MTKDFLEEETERQTNVTNNSLVAIVSLCRKLLGSSSHKVSQHLKNQWQEAKYMQRVKQYRLGIYWISSIIVSQPPIICDTAISCARNNIIVSTGQ